MTELLGADKAAVFLLTIGEEEASKIMKHMNPHELELLGTKMSTLKEITRDVVDGAVSDFVTVIQNQTSLGVGGDSYLREVLTKALGSEKADGVIDRILLAANSQGLEALKWMAPKSVAELIRFEHPQIIALVLSYLDAGQAAEVLSLLPENTHTDIMVRIASLDGIPPQAIRELDRILEQHVSSDNNLQAASLGGVESAAAIINQLSGTMEGSIMDGLKEQDAEMSERISDLMFVFDDLSNVDDRAIQTILREVATDQLVMALKGASEDLQEKILRNMSQRASEMLREDMEAKGPVRLSDVEVAQKDIVTTARRLESEGSIMLGGGGEEFV